MIVSEFTHAELSRRLRGRGLRIRLGPVAASIRSPMPAVADALGFHYAAHETLDEDEFVDFDVHVAWPQGVRRFVRPTATFSVDDTTTFEPLPANQGFPLFEWGMNWCIAAYCDQFLILHSAVLERNGDALLLPAPPGSGKSTLCAALVARGWRLLSDELALIDIERLVVLPIPRPISLKNAAIDVIRAFWPEAAIGPVVPDTLKGSVGHVRPPALSVERQRETARPRWIVLPKYESGAALTLSAISRGAALMRLVDSAFNYTVHGKRGFETLAAIVDRAECRALLYGGDLDAAVRALEAMAAAA
ncbi:MAG TPA: HprK-related kinase A [Casimicrobiaceae bacterium]